MNASLRTRLHTLFALGLLLLVAAGPHGCRCGEDPEVPQKEAMGVAGLPDEYPDSAGHAAESLAPYIPQDTDAVTFVASYASLVAATDTVKDWGLVDADEMEGIFASLERYHGINPGRAQSYVDNGLPLTGGLAIGRIEGAWFAISKVGDQDRFSAFIDRLINEEFGRPRPHPSTHAGVELQQINVLKRDLLTIAFVDDVAIIAAGERLIADSPRSDETMKTLLGTDTGGALAGSEAFEGMLDRLGESGQVMLYTSESQLASELMKPITGGNELLQKLVERQIVAGTEAFGLAFSAKGEALRARSYAAMKPDIYASTRAVVAPENTADTDLSRFVGSDVRGLLRATFAPRAAEQRALGLLGEKPAKEWNKIKSQATVPFVVNFEDEVLYNLAGYAVLTLFEVDEDDLVPGDDLLTILRSGASAALYVPMRDVAKANGFFGKVNALKGVIGEMVPKGRVKFGEIDGVLVVTLRDKRRPLARVAYHDGVLAVATAGDENTIRTVIARLKGTAPPKPTSPNAKDTTTASPTVIDRDLLAPGAVWGASVDMREVVKVLSARYDIVKMQIHRFLAPLAGATFVIDFGDEGIGMQLTVNMRSANDADDE